MNGVSVTRLLQHRQNATEASRANSLKLDKSMSISVTKNESQNMVTITIVGSFDFSLFNDFREAYSELNNFKIYIIDMSMVEYLDSAALGMLLSMRNAINVDSNIQLKGANSFIKNILMISRFDKRFEIQ